MNLELAAAKGTYRDLELKAKAKKQLAKEYRQLIHQASSPMIDEECIDAGRIMILAGELLMLLDGQDDSVPPNLDKIGLRVVLAKMKELKQEYGL
jgi:hypothetical protein